MYAKYDKFTQWSWPTHAALGLGYFLGCWYIFRFSLITLANLCLLLLPALNARRVSTWLAKGGINPNHLTILGFLLALGSVWPLATGRLELGASIYLYSVLLDVLDGYMARQANMSSPRGGFLDSVLDRVADSCLFGGLLIHFADTERMAWAYLTLACLVGAFLVSYARARAECFLPLCDVGFLGERPDRNFVMISTLIWGKPHWGIVFVLITTWLTASRRIKFTWDRLGESGQSTVNK